MWRVGTLGGAGAPGYAFYGIELMTLLFSLLLGALLWRGSTPLAAPGAPSGTLDLFIPVCGEPVELVEETLRAALAVAYPHRTYVLNDGLRAGKEGWEEIVALAARYGVACFTRSSGARGKAGNLNHALRHTDGELVAVVDADHRADPAFAHETLGYFRDSDVAFVCTPQQFDVDGQDRLGNRELFFYRVLQAAKDRDNAAFSCGNASVYRRAALDSVGGFSEWGLVEDLHTSYRLHATGWRSVYHPHAVTTGKAPETVAAYVKQRLTWATDSLRILIWDSPLWKRGLSAWQRLHYLHTTAFYAVAACFTLYLAAPALQLLFGVTLLPVSSPAAYLAHAGPYVAAIGLFLAWHAGAGAGLRSVRTSLFLAPICVIALARALSPRKPACGVTPKGRLPEFSALLVPYELLLAVTAVAIGSALRIGDAGAGVSGFWAAWIVLSLTPATTMFDRPRPLRSVRVAARIAVGMAALTVAFAFGPIGAFGRGTPSVHSGTLGVRYLLADHTAARAPHTPERLVAPASGVYLGAFDPASASPLGGALRILNRFQQWRSGDSRFPSAWAQQVAGAGVVPMLTWEPWAKPRDGVYDPDQAGADLERIVSGRDDAYIRAWAASAARFGRPVLLRFMHEANGDWYPWSVRTNGNSPALFVAAWRRVHRIFDRAGAANVSWVWDVNSFRGLPEAGRRLRAFYPGEKFVDWVSMTGFNWGTSYPWNTWEDFDTIFHDVYLRLSGFGKPVMISELGTVASGGDARTWTRDALAGIRASYPRLKAVVWFDARYPGDAGVDFRLHAPERREIAQAARGPFYRPPLNLRKVRTPLPRPAATSRASLAPSAR